MESLYSLDLKADTMHTVILQKYRKYALQKNISLWKIGQLRRHITLYNKLEIVKTIKPPQLPGFRGTITLI